MKKFTKFAVLTLAFLVAVGAFAGEHSLNLSSAVTLNGVTLPAGKYKVKYEPNGTSAEVQFLQGKKTVTTASAQVVEAKKQSRDSITTSGDTEGSPKLVAVQFANEPTQIRFSGEGAGGGK